MYALRISRGILSVSNSFQHPFSRYEKRTFRRYLPLSTQKHPHYIDFLCATRTNYFIEVASQAESVRKVGENVADKDIIKKLADECGGVFRTSDLAALGYNTYAIRKIVESQIIERIKQGYYRLCKVDEPISEAAQVSQLFPDGVLCMYTACSITAILTEHLWNGILPLIGIHPNLVLSWTTPLCGRIT